MKQKRTYQTHQSQIRAMKLERLIDRILIITLIVGMILLMVFYLSNISEKLPDSNNDPNLSMDYPTTVQIITETMPETSTSYIPDSFGHIVSISDEERLLIATVIDEKAEFESDECKQAIASTILNRYLISGKAISDIIYTESDYGISKDTAYAEPSLSAITAVQYVEHFGTILPEYVTHFRANKYHDWGDQEPFVKIDNTYFSYSAAEKEVYECSLR